MALPRDPCFRRCRRSCRLPHLLPLLSTTQTHLSSPLATQTKSADAALSALFGALAESTEQPPAVAVVLVGESSPAVQAQLDKLATAAPTFLQLPNAAHEVGPAAVRFPLRQPRHGAGLPSRNLQKSLSPMHFPLLRGCRVPTTRCLRLCSAAATLCASR